MYQAGGAINKKTKQPTNYKNNGYDIKYASHDKVFLVNNVCCFKNLAIKHDEIIKWNILVCIE